MLTNLNQLNSHICASMPILPSFLATLQAYPSHVFVSSVSLLLFSRFSNFILKNHEPNETKDRKEGHNNA